MNRAQQSRMYGPTWTNCAKARGWVMRDGRLQADLAWQLDQATQWPEPAGTLLAQVIHGAQTLAQQDHRGVTADDLRHGCNLLVSGQPKGNKLSQKELTRVCQLFRLLSDPENTGAIDDWLRPGEAERRYLVSQIRSLAPDATILVIARNMHLPAPWDTASAVGALRSLYRLLSERARHRLGGEQPF